MYHCEFQTSVAVNRGGSMQDRTWFRRRAELPYLPERGVFIAFDADDYEGESVRSVVYQVPTATFVVTFDIWTMQNEEEHRVFCTVLTDNGWDQFERTSD